MSPVFLIVVSLALTSAMLSVIFFTAWKTMDRMPHALTWSATFLVATVQWTTNLLGGTFLSYEFYWVVVNAMSLAVVSLGLFGHFQRVGIDIKGHNLLLPAALCLTLILWFTVVNPHVGLRMGLTPAYAAVTLIIASVVVLRHRSKPRPAEWGAAITMSSFALIELIAAGAAVMQGANFDEIFLNIYRQVNFLALPAAYTGMGMFVLFMLASDLSESMKDAAMHDQLTGLLNRRGFNDAATKAYATARRTERPISVIMTDIDRFKEINDQHGHIVGDQGICHFAWLLSDRRRAEDILARVGGEEFALVLPGTDVKDCVTLAKELRRRLQDTPLEFQKGDLKMTASFGVATLSARDTCLADVILRADTALYRSKNKGRNRVDLQASQIMLMADGQLRPITA